MNKLSIASALLLIGLTSACAGSSGSPAGGPSGSSTGTPSATPSATPRTAAQDAADLKQALVTPADLGAPWVQPKTVSRSGGKAGEICPGHTSATDKVTFIASVSADLTEGKGAGKNIESYRLSTLPDEDVSALVAGYEADHKACARYTDPSGFRVVRTVEGPTSVDGAEVITAWAERIYYVQPRNKLAYARHYIVIHQGRVVTWTGYAFLTDKTDPNAKDFGKATRLLQVQRAKTAGVFG